MCVFLKGNAPPHLRSASMALSLVSVNVNGLRDADKRFNFLR